MHSISLSNPMPVSSRFTPEGAVDQPDGGEVLDAREAKRLELAEEDLGDHERIGGADSGQDRGVLDGRQHLVGHLLDDGVGVAVGHEPGQRARGRPSGTGPSCR